MAYKVLITTVSRTFITEGVVHGNSIVVDFDTPEEADSAVINAPKNSLQAHNAVTSVKAIRLN